MVNLMLGVTGSVATIKLPMVIEKFLESKRDLEIKVVTTEAAKHFLKEQLKRDSSGLLTLEVLGKIIPVFDDSHEWKLRKWADIFVLCPLDANTLGKMANGLCDNFLTCILRAWDIKNPQKNLLAAPAMNTLMWDHPFTAKHLQSLQQDLNVIIIPPISKTLACGDTGIGAMASVDTIIDRTLSFLPTDP